MSDRNQDMVNYWFDGLVILGGLYLAYRILWKGLVVLGSLLNFVGCVLGVGVAYLGFFVLPFALVSLASGWLMAVASGIGEFDFRKALLVQGALWLLAAGIVGFPVPKMREVVEMTKASPPPITKKLEHRKRKELPVGSEMHRLEIRVQSPRLFEAYARFRQGTEKVGEALLPASYDLANLSACVWLGLLFGGPLFFFLVSRGPKKVHEKEVADFIRSPLQQELESVTAELNRARHQSSELQWRLTQANQELERLRARDEFLTQKEKLPAEPTGILDSDQI